MKKQIFFEENRVLVFLVGAIHTEDADRLRPELMDCIAKGHKNFLIDMENVDYIDSAGIAMFLAVQKVVTKLDGKVTLQRLKGGVKDLFEITQLGTVFGIEE
ncbi:STAS domain-containing protein [Pelosinus sp. sgz500959]|uniref:STAS domain-containing protein n=1 Tax=Pelosinus sp. sgz500959 TaxID=3242472 RepID=UPI00366B6003